MTAPPADSLPVADRSALGVLARCPVVPVLVMDDPGDAVPLAHALLAGGVTVVEVTLRTPAAEETLRRMAAVSGLLAGAGTVITPAQVDLVAAAGAGFVVSPGLSVEVVDRCLSHGLPVIPGVGSATDSMAAVALGLEAVKLFPADLLGGTAAIRALAGPFPDLRFLPSGGIGPDTMADYLDLPSVGAVSGSWIVEPELIRRQDWPEVTRRARAALRVAADAGWVGRPS
ncbi:bifunctional 4-hydroxy-2-oxoglutarate aldolase/2-dehydro-3-deoxy-phosphogluconate aldolase [Nocardioides sp. NBC_00850]|uniref:bifunctional 4-hydroxy-2-oxoglutarate aldolase/2-dehydro-3-deoxy-phosphogluconate aldolase n=1 Tax=Nocardioides sp. NBC_00850 TaxID=2976001 RepID=UPI00386C93ED|nr:bifunctional 4-hydroxy-2-oxoglutarate aldolase/2-dehydro-3-deoxy-phosphogluconate aldolase [Nocardioides sp. NBC_00850]